MVPAPLAAMSLLASRGRFTITYECFGTVRASASRRLGNELPRMDHTHDRRNARWSVIHRRRARHSADGERADDQRRPA
jgi:hypothetical protein